MLNRRFLLQRCSRFLPRIPPRACFISMMEISSAIAQFVLEASASPRATVRAGRHGRASWRSGKGSPRWRSAQVQLSALVLLSGTSRTSLRLAGLSASRYLVGS
jgi:hypothetical protein